MTPKLDPLDLVTENPRVQAEVLRRVNHLLLDAVTSMVRLISVISIVCLRRAVTALMSVLLSLGVFALAIAIAGQDEGRTRSVHIASIPREGGMEGEQRKVLRGEKPIRTGISRVSPVGDNPRIELMTRRSLGRILLPLRREPLGHPHIPRAFLTTLIESPRLLLCQHQAGVPLLVGRSLLTASWERSPPDDGYSLSGGGEFQ